MKALRVRKKRPADCGPFLIGTILIGNLRLGMTTAKSGMAADVVA
jgi:hypothetical protein